MLEVDINQIRKKYLNEKKSQKEIAGEMDISQAYVSKIMKEKDIKTRDHSEALKNRDDWVEDRNSKEWKEKISATKKEKWDNGEYEITSKMERALTKGRKNSQVREKARQTRMENSNINSLKNWEKGYIAGFLDADGYLGIRNKPQCKPEIAFYNTDRKTLARIRNILGSGNLFLNRKARGNAKKGFALTINKFKEMKDVLKQVEDFLETKYYRSQILREYLERIINEKLSSKEKLEYYKEMRKLNKRGRN